MRAYIVYEIVVILTPGRIPKNHDANSDFNLLVDPTFTKTVIFDPAQPILERAISSVKRCTRVRNITTSFACLFPTCPIPIIGTFDRVPKQERLYFRAG